LGGLKCTYLIYANSTGFPSGVCITFFNGPAGNKDAMVPNPLMEEKSHHFYNRDIERLSGSTKCWIFFKKYVKYVKFTA